MKIARAEVMNRIITRPWRIVKSFHHSLRSVNKPKPTWKPMVTE